MKNINDVLEEVFSQTPLPNSLKARKARWQRGTLGIASKISVILHFTDYEVVEHSIEVRLKVKTDAMDTSLGTGWIRCSERLPALRKRVIVTDGVISTIGWISDYKKGWEGWIVLDNEYLNDIVAWREFPPPCI